jgi:hypothetical protein
MGEWQCRASKEHGGVGATSWLVLIFVIAECRASKEHGGVGATSWLVLIFIIAEWRGGGTLAREERL